MKRHKSLSLLSSDHHHGLRISKLLKNAGSSQSLENVLSEFTAFYKSKLLHHFETEEKYLAAQLPNNPLIIRMCEEHKEMKEMFAALTTGNNLKDDLISFGNFLENHIRFEERELFPMIESTLPEDTLNDIAMKINKEVRTISY